LFTKRTQRTLLHNNFFGALQRVDISVSTWELTDADIREIAQERGYVEIAGPQPGMLSFTVPPGYDAATDPAAPAEQYPRSEKHERKLEKQLNGAEYAWVSTRESQLSTVVIAEIATRQGFSLARTLGDRVERIHLVSSFAMPDLAGFAGEQPAMNKWSNQTAFGVMASRRWDLTTRMRELILEFTGSPSVVIKTEILRLPETVISQVARELGYAFTALSWNDRYDMCAGYVKVARY
jgi:hypothetical protein